MIFLRTKIPLFPRMVAGVVMEESTGLLRRYIAVRQLTGLRKKVSDNTPEEVAKVYCTVV